MAKIKNDPAGYKKRSDLAKPHGSYTPDAKPLTLSQKGDLADAMSRFGFQKAGFIAFGPIIRKKL